jgi:hypothetical protein
MGTGAIRYKQPAPEDYIVFGGELDVLSLNHLRSFQVSASGTTSTIGAVHPRRGHRINPGVGRDSFRLMG